MAIVEGNYVSVEYEGKLEDGTVFDSTANHGGDPLSFTVGKGELIKGFDTAVLGMEKGDEKEVTIKPEEGYGEYNEKHVQEVPRKEVTAIEDPKEGMTIGLRGPQGQVIPAQLTKVTDETLTIDLNHPLAGKTLIFNIKITDVQDKAPEGCGDHCACNH